MENKNRYFIVSIFLWFKLFYDEQLTCDIPAIPKKSEGFLI